MISPIISLQVLNKQNINNFSQKSNIKVNDKQTFTGNPYAEKIARNYMHVKNYHSCLVEAIKEHFGYLNTDILVEATNLIQKYRAENIIKNFSLLALTKKVEQLTKKINEENEKHQILEKEISKVNTINAIEKLKLSKIVASEKRKTKMEELLRRNYIELHKLNEKTYPNAMMLRGLQDEDEQKHILKYLTDKENKLFKINFNDIPLKTVNKELDQIFKRIASEGEQTLLYIENFDKYTISTEKNFNFINKLKGALCICGNKYKTTLLVFENNPERLDSAIVGGHRFKNLDVSDIKNEITSCFVPKFDGYTFIYGVNDDEMVDLYLGNFGQRRDTLWINSDQNKRIRAVLERLPEVVKQEKFKDIKYIQFPEPETLEGIKYAMEVSNTLTEDFKHHIYCVWRYDIFNG